MKGLAIQAGVFLGLLAAGDVWLARYGPAHFIPEQKLAAAVAAGRDAPAVVVTGDSRMVAALDFGVFRAELSRLGMAAPVDDLTLGAVDCAGQAVVLRALRERRPAPAPRALVMGVVGDSLLEPAEPLEPDLLIGNQAVVSLLSKPGDVLVHYPRFPWADLDPGMRFSLARLTALGAYKSILWMKVRVAQDRIVGRAAGDNDVNEFGLVGDMARYASALRARADERLRAAKSKSAGGRGWRLNPWFDRLRQALRSDGTPLVLVELPMPESYRENVTRTPAALAMRQWLAEELAADGGLSIDLSDGPALGLTDADFPDQLHMTPRAGKLVSAALARRLAEFLERIPERSHLDRPGAR